MQINCNKNLQKIQGRIADRKHEGEMVRCDEDIGSLEKPACCLKLIFVL
jgi:hypothetical protein